MYVCLQKVKREGPIAKKMLWGQSPKSMTAMLEQPERTEKPKIDGDNSNPQHVRLSRRRKGASEGSTKNFDVV